MMVNATSATMATKTMVVTTQNQRRRRGILERVLQVRLFNRYLDGSILEQHYPFGHRIHRTSVAKCGSRQVISRIDLPRPSVSMADDAGMSITSRFIALSHIGVRVLSCFVAWFLIVNGGLV
jgi:hypothetical protein